jgi:hypothetical protein
MQFALVQGPTSNLPAQKVSRHKPISEPQKLKALVAAWRKRATAASATPATIQKPTWKGLLQSYGYEGQDDGWAGALAGDVEQLDGLRRFLQQADPAVRQQAHADITKAIQKELAHFSRCLAEDPTSERFSFVLFAPRLEELHNMVGEQGLAVQIEEALHKFDQQLAARRTAMRARLQWKPKQTPKRVDTRLAQEEYQPGQPHWLSGRLKDAPIMLGQKLTIEKAERVAIALERSLLKHLGNSTAPRAKWPKVTLDNTYFSQGQEPRVQFGQLKDAPGVEGYLKDAPNDGPRVLEFPLEDGTFAYLMFDGHHRAAAQIINGSRKFKRLTVMQLHDVEQRFGLTEQDIIEAIRDLHTHLYMTDTPVPR